MQYWGKIIGVTAALIMGGDFWDVVLGLLISHMLDKARNRRMAWFANQRERQALFSAIAFEAMGHLAEFKGRVTKADTHIAGQLTDRMNLYGASRIVARNAFRVGRSDNYPLCEKVRQPRSVYFGRFDLIRMSLETQIQAAFADSSLHPNKRAALYVIAEELGISRTQFDQPLRMMQGGTRFGGGHQQQSSGGSWQQTQRGPTLKDVYNVLGVKPTGDVTTIRRAYRELMSGHHSDKLVVKGLSLEMMGMARQKAQEIQQACELIKQQKGLRQVSMCKSDKT